MTSFRSIERLIQGPAQHWVGDGFHVSSILPTGLRSAIRMSPFFLLDYHAPYAYKPTDSARRGVGPHPHRGLETVTLALAGSVAHHDSAGNSGVIHPGDVQWMTAGSGILHKEYHEANFAKQGGVMHMVQLWVNLPKAHKMTTPRYQGITKEQIPNVGLPGGVVRVIAGDYEGTKGPALTFSPLDLYEVRLAKDGVVNLRLPAAANTALLLLQGSITVNDTHAADSGSLVLFDNNKGEIKVHAKAADTSLLVMSGEPLREPVVAHGPFLMNTVEEIHQAFADFSEGKFGELAD